MPVKKEDTKPTRRGRDVEEETTSTRRGASTEKESTSPKTTGSGWGNLANRKKQIEDSKDEDSIRDFWLADGETAQVQFITDEPYCVDGHNVKTDAGKWGFEVCQLMEQRHCLMCRTGIKKTWKAAFKVLDYRGTWDTDKKKFKHDKQVEKLWLVGSTIAEQLKAITDKRGKPLTEMVLEISRSGSGKSVSYNFEPAFDKDDKKLIPVEWEEEYPELEELVVPKNDAKLEARGFSAGD